MSFMTLAKPKVRLPEGDADASKRVGVNTMYKVLLIIICCAFVGVVNKLYNMHGTYIKMKTERSCTNISTRTHYLGNVSVIPYILESNPHSFYSFRGLKNQMRIRFAVVGWILEKW